MSRIVTYTSILFVFLMSGSLYANEHFDEGIKAANQKNYKQALVAFEQVVAAEPGNSSAYFNLGNCYYEVKQYGNAIWAYEKVLKLASGDGEAALNIQQCYKKLGEELEYQPHLSGIQRLIYKVGPNSWAWMALIFGFLLAFSIFVLFKTANSSMRRLHFALGFGEIILVIAFVIAAKEAHYLDKAEHFAIVTGKDIPTYLNEKGELAALKLHEGTKVEVLKTTNEKTEVFLQDGRKVIISSTDLRVI